MSTQNRKIGFYEIYIENISGQYREDPKMLIDALNYASSLPVTDRLIDNSKLFKAYALESVEIENNLVMAIMNAGKYNHIPPLINVRNGLRRRSPKDLEEAEIESTHVGLSFRDEYIACVFEERRVGMSFKSFVNYLETMLIKYCNKNDIKFDFKFEFAILTKKNFEAAVKELERVTEIFVTADKKILDGEFLDYSERNEEAKDGVKLQIVAKRSLSLKHMALGIFKKKQDNNLIERIEVSGYNEDRMKIWVKTDIIRRIDYVKAIVDSATGIVKSESIFFQYKKLLATL